MAHSWVLTTLCEGKMVFQIDRKLLATYPMSVKEMPSNTSWKIYAALYWKFQSH